MSFAFFAYSTDLIAVPRILRKLRLPKSFCLAVYISLRFLPEVEKDFSEIRAVQKTRGITPKKPLLFLKSHFIPLVYLILDRTDQLTIAYHLKEKNSSSINK
jgi:energy-coupling factor transporter transmembrane protein EcfT